MSVQEQINRINDAKTAIGNAIAEKGVDVPSGTKLYGMAALIGEIEGGQSGGIPAGYTELECLTSTGSEYINTDYIPNQDTRVLMDVKLAASSSVNWLFGARTASQNNSFALLAVSGGYRADYGTLQYLFSNNFTDRFTIDFNKNVVTLNGASMYTFTAQTLSAPVSMILFGVNTNGTITKSTGASIYSCKIFEGGTIVRDYVPCIRNSDMMQGMYDKVNAVFYKLDGTGGAGKRCYTGTFTGTSTATLTINTGVTLEDTDICILLPDSTSAAGNVTSADYMGIYAIRTSANAARAGVLINGWTNFDISGNSSIKLSYSGTNIILSIGVYSVPAMTWRWVIIKQG